MRNTLGVLLVACFAILLSSSAFSQQAVPPPPTPAPDGPSLAAPMQFIQTKLQERGRLNFAVYTHDNADGKDYIDQYSGEPTNFQADAATCKISYHRNLKKNGTVLADSDVSFSLHDVRDLVVLPADQEMKLPGIPRGTRESNRRCFWLWREKREIRAPDSIFSTKMRLTASQKQWSTRSSFAAAATRIRFRA